MRGIELRSESRDGLRFDFVGYLVFDAHLMHKFCCSVCVAWNTSHTHMICTSLERGFSRPVTWLSKLKWSPEVCSLVAGREGIVSMSCAVCKYLYKVHLTIFIPSPYNIPHI